MKRVVVFLMLLIALASISHAADLQAGWYASIDSVAFRSDGPHGPQPQAEGIFTIPSGTYGPFAVTNLNNWDSTRQITVPAHAPNVNARDSLILPLYTNTSLEPSVTVGYIVIGWQTDYDASQMQLQFWHSRNDGTADLLWQQNSSDYHYGFATTGRNLAYENGFFFRVAVVPEPSSLLAGLVGVSGILVHARRRRA